jgi:nucleoside-diphosphate-sugar epimerase
MAEGLEVAVVNPSIILGPGDWKRSSDAIFRKIWEGLRFYTLGVTGWVDVRDVVQAMLLLTEKRIHGERFIVSAENLPYRTVFDWVADDLGRPRPSVSANAFLRGLAWRAEALKCALLKKRPLVTRETARAAGMKVRFSSEKLQAATGMNFIPIRESVRRTCKIFLADQRAGR